MDIPGHQITRKYNRATHSAYSGTRAVRLEYERHRYACRGMIIRVTAIDCFDHSVN